MADPRKLSIGGIRGALFGWSYWRYYSVAHVGYEFTAKRFLSAYGGPLIHFDPTTISTAITSASLDT